LVAKTVLRRDNGIEERWLAVPSLKEAFVIDPDTLHRRFAVHAPNLATNAAMCALKRASLAPEAIDAIIVTTCTGYLCPGLSGYVIERVGLASGVLGFDLVGQGCAGALPNWQLANALLQSRQCDHVLSICVEVSSAAMYLDDDPGVIISACLFGDGAGAAVLSRDPIVTHRTIEWKDSASVIDPALRDALRFEHRSGMLRNILTRAVPALAADHAAKVLDQVLVRASLERCEISTWILHAGGRDVLRAMEKRLGLEPINLCHSAAMLHEYGNLSSAFVYFVLDAALRSGERGGWWWLCSFGAGFSCYGALLKVE
jgi:alkylresorcinol/alkylpyrone synthase